jgi:hypothetical protein
VTNNLIYIGNIQALQLWYRLVRQRMMTADPFSRACYDGAMGRIDAVLDERVKRLADLSERMVRSLELARVDRSLALPRDLAAQQQALVDRWPEMEPRLRADPVPETGSRERDAFLSSWERIDTATPYIKAVGSLSPEAKKAGTAWLQAVVDSVSRLWQAV